jgi:putative phosphoribosyl transferase
MFADRIDAGKKLAQALKKYKDKDVILVDDGLAMGSTMQAAIMLCKNKGAKKIIVAVPVAGEEVVEKMNRLASEVVVLEKPLFFKAVAQVYKNWYDVSDEEVVKIMKDWKEITERDL